MRRNDREVTDEREIEEIISSCACCRLGFDDRGSVYIVPLNFGYVKSGGKYTFYFHGARAGRKYELLKESPIAAFEMDCGYELIQGKTACSSSALFRSVMGSGRASIVEDEAEKHAGLLALMEHCSGRADWKFQDEALASVCVFRLEVSELSAKEHI